MGVFRSVLSLFSQDLIQHSMSSLQQCVCKLTSSQWNRQVCEDLSLTRSASDDLGPSYSYVDNTTAFALNLSYISWDGKVIMKGDDTTTLQANQNRNRCGLPDDTITNC